MFNLNKDEIDRLYARSHARSHDYGFYNHSITLGFKIFLTAVRAQKIDGSFFKTFYMVIASFLVLNKLNRACIFFKTFVLVDISIKIVFDIPFLIFNNANIKFANKQLA